MTETYTIRPQETGSQDPMDILAMYEELERPPRLSQKALSTVLGFFDEAGLIPIVGTIPKSNQIGYGSMLTTAMLRSECFNQLHRRQTAGLPNGSYLGPYVLLDMYYPTGLAVWSPIQETK